MYPQTKLITALASAKVAPSTPTHLFPPQTVKGGVGAQPPPEKKSLPKMGRACDSVYISFSRKNAILALFDVL